MIINNLKKQEDIPEPKGTGLHIPKHQLWEEQMRAWKECQARVRRKVISPWESEQAAWRYFEDTRRFQKERIDFLLARIKPAAEKKILDIGAGPGVLAIPLSEAGCEVTAVEPSAAMVKVLRKMAEARTCPPVRYLTKFWEEVDPASELSPPYDAVIASLSLLMSDIRHCLLKMRQVCCGPIYLLWPRSRTPWTEQLTGLYPELYGFDYVPKPGAELLLEVVQELSREMQQYSIKAKTTETPAHEKTRTQESAIQAEEVELLFRESFSSPDEALAHFRDYFGIYEADKTALLTDFLRHNLKPHNGRYLLEHPFSALLITWEGNPLPHERGFPVPF